MDCSEARMLIRAGAIPNDGPGPASGLGRHLAGCPACRAFRSIERLERAPAPAVLPPPGALSRPGLPPSGSLPKPVQLRPVPRRSALRPLRVALAIMLLLCLAPGWYFGVPLARAWHDINTMTSLPAPARLPQTRNVVARGAPALAAPLVAKSSAKIVEQAAGSNVPTMVQEEPAAPELTELPTEAPTPAPTEVPTPEVLPELVPTTAVNVLVLGIDARPGEGLLARSDVIMIARLDPERQRVALLSLPRDLWVTIPGYGEGKIDRAHFLGEQYGDGGAAVARETVSQALGIPIDYTAVIDFNGFRGVIDTLGGVPVDVPRELYDPAFPTEDYGYTVAHFTPGTEVMNSDRALMYSRIRHPDSDFERMRRQQAVVLGVAAKLRERGILRNLAEADRLTAALRSYVRTDLQPTMALSLLWALRSVDTNAVQRVTADTSLLGETNIGGAYALLADPAVLHSLGAQLIAAP